MQQLRYICGTSPMSPSWRLVSRSGASAVTLRQYHGGNNQTMANQQWSGGPSAKPSTHRRAGSFHHGPMRDAVYGAYDAPRQGDDASRRAGAGKPLADVPSVPSAASEWNQRSMDATSSRLFRGFPSSPSGLRTTTLELPTDTGLDLQRQLAPSSGRSTQRLAPFLDPSDDASAADLEGVNGARVTSTDVVVHQAVKGQVVGASMAAGHGKVSTAGYHSEDQIGGQDNQQQHHDDTSYTSRRQQSGKHSFRRPQPSAVEEYFQQYQRRRPDFSSYLEDYTSAVVLTGGKSILAHSHTPLSQQEQMALLLKKKKETKEKQQQTRQGLSLQENAERHRSVLGDTDGDGDVTDVEDPFAGSGNRGAHSWNNTLASGSYNGFSFFGNVSGSYLHRRPLHSDGTTDTSQSYKQRMFMRRSVIPPSVARAELAASDPMLLRKYRADGTGRTIPQSMSSLMVGKNAASWHQLKEMNSLGISAAVAQGKQGAGDRTTALTSREAATKGVPEGQSSVTTSNPSPTVSKESLLHSEHSLVVPLPRWSLLQQQSGLIRRANQDMYAKAARLPAFSSDDSQVGGKNANDGTRGNSTTSSPPALQRWFQQHHDPQTHIDHLAYIRQQNLLRQAAQPQPFRCRSCSSIFRAIPADVLPSDASTGRMIDRTKKQNRGYKSALNKYQYGRKGKQEHVERGSRSALRSIIEASAVSSRVKGCPFCQSSQVEWLVGHVHQALHDDVATKMMTASGPSP